MFPNSQISLYLNWDIFIKSVLDKRSANLSDSTAVNLRDIVNNAVDVNPGNFKILSLVL